MEPHGRHHRGHPWSYRGAIVNSSFGDAVHSRWSRLRSWLRSISSRTRLEDDMVELSIVGKSFLCLHAARYVVYM